MRFFKIRLYEEVNMRDIEPFGERVPSDSAVLIGAMPVYPCNMGLDEMIVGGEGKFTFPMFKDKIFVVECLENTARKCYYACESFQTSAGEYFIAEVTENEPGYRRTVVVFPKFKEAEDFARGYNLEKLGLDEAWSNAIVTSSMRIGNAERSNASTARNAITEIDGLLQEGFDTNAEDVTMGLAEGSYDMDAVKETLEELGYLTKGDPETLAWLEETYPELHKVVTAE